MTLFGVNVPFLGGEYGHDLAPNGRHPSWPCSFDALDAYAPLIEARRNGFSAVRMWLCENAEGIVVDASGRISGVHPKLIESVQIIDEAAALHGLRMYWTLLDGNACAREGDPITRSILTEEDQLARFAERVVAPLVRVMNPEHTFAVEVINEPETSTRGCLEPDAEVEPIAWSAIGRAIRIVKRAIVAEHELLVSSGTMHVFLDALIASDPELTAIDIHVYHPNGGLPSRADLAAYVGSEALLDESLPLIGGELGIPKDPGPETPASLTNYLYNARTLGYTAAFLWQLEGDLIDKSGPARARSWLSWEVAQVIQTLGDYQSV